MQVSSWPANRKDLKSRRGVWPRGWDSTVRCAFRAFWICRGKCARATPQIFLSTRIVLTTCRSASWKSRAMGLPVKVATAVGGVPDLLTDGETGLLVPDSDDRAMVQAIKRLLSESELAGRLSANGRRLAERSAWESVRLQWEQVFKEVGRDIEDWRLTIAIADWLKSFVGAALRGRPMFR